MPQGSILVPLFFNIFINDFFLFIETTTLCNYADDNIMYSSDKNANSLSADLDMRLCNDIRMVLQKPHGS